MEGQCTHRHRLRYLRQRGAPVSFGRLTRIIALSQRSVVQAAHPLSQLVHCKINVREMRQEKGTELQSLISENMHRLRKMPHRRRATPEEIPAESCPHRFRRFLEADRK